MVYRVVNGGGTDSLCVSVSECRNDNTGVTHAAHLKPHGGTADSLSPIHCTAEGPRGGGESESSCRLRGGHQTQALFKCNNYLLLNLILTLGNDSKDILKATAPTRSPSVQFLEGEGSPCFTQMMGLL